MTNQDRQYKHDLRIQRKKILRDIHWAINVRYMPIAQSEFGFLFDPLASSVPIIGVRELPSMFITFYIHTFN